MTLQLRSCLLQSMGRCSGLKARYLDSIHIVPSCCSLTHRVKKGLLQSHSQSEKRAPEALKEAAIARLIHRCVQLPLVRKERSQS
jgi:hypothetical protein